MPSHAPRALQVDADDRVELLLGHREDHLVAQDAGVVDDDVEAAEGFDGLVDDVARGLEVGHVVVVGDRVAAAIADDRSDLLGRALVGALAGHRTAEVVDHDLGAGGGQLESFASSNSVAGPRDNGNFAVEQSHVAVPLPLLRRFAWI